MLFHFRFTETHHLPSALFHFKRGLDWMLFGCTHDTPLGTRPGAKAHYFPSERSHTRSSEGLHQILIGIPPNAHGSTVFSGSAARCRKSTPRGNEKWRGFKKKALGAQNRRSE